MLLKHWVNELQITALGVFIKRLTPSIISFFDEILSRRRFKAEWRFFCFSLVRLEKYFSRENVTFDALCTSIFLSSESSDINRLSALLSSLRAEINAVFPHFLLLISRCANMSPSSYLPK